MDQDHRRSRIAWSQLLLLLPCLAGLGGCSLSGNNCAAFTSGYSRVPKASLRSEVPLSVAILRARLVVAYCYPKSPFADYGYTFSKIAFWYAVKGEDGSIYLIYGVRQLTDTELAFRIDSDGKIRSAHWYSDWG